MKKPNCKERINIRFAAPQVWWLSTPRPGAIFARADCGAALLAALAAFWLYLQTLGPTITGEDSGEFVTAAYVLGVPHPPGYPLYCLIGHLFTRLPWGEAAWRVNLMSACFGAGAVFWLALIVIYLTRNRIAGFMAALALACSREFWAQSVVAEVYSMNAFFFALCLLLLLLWGDTRRGAYLVVCAFFCGLGVSVHYTFVLLAPVFAAYIFCLNATAPAADRLRAKTFLAAGGAVLLGLLVFLYLPIRSRANPPLDWGNPETLRNFYHVIRRSQYAFMFDQYPRSMARFAGQMATYGRFWLGEFMPWGAAFGLWGLLIALRRHFRHGLLFWACGLIIPAGFAYWQNFEQTREWLWVMRVFAIPAYMISAVGMGVAIETLWRRNSLYAAVAVVLALSCIVGSLHVHWRRNDKSDYYWTRDYGMNILASLPTDAIYVSQSDHGSFSVLYLQETLGMRPDVENLRKYGYLESPLLDAMPSELREKIGEFPPLRHDPEIFAWLLANTDRPLYLSKPMRLPDAPEARFAPAGLLFRALRPGEKPSGRDYWREYGYTMERKDTHGDYTAAAILFDINIARAYAALMAMRRTDGAAAAANRDKALKHIEEALRAYGRDPVVLNNAGVICARYGLYQNARAYFLEARQKLPTLPELHHNLKKAEHRLKR
ncbi:MAG TPA: DUF2723 domain-containing protein [Candidatus Hydrogenedentes bacterium]|nr:DUF2723 domain-containing protein [Candidatus Hydrogenedentota bacterium]